MATYVRRPAVAGTFYPGKPDVLLHKVQEYSVPSGPNLDAIGCVAPHAGYMYSGHVAGAVYGRLKLPDRFIILCPNHTGYGAPLAIESEGRWITPLGDANIDTELASALKQADAELEEDHASQIREHATEVQLPFIQARKQKFTFVPITVGTGKFDSLHALGEAIGRVIATVKEQVMIVASSDMNHYEPDKVTRIKDHKAIEKILALDERGLFDVINTERISMCGFGPAIAMITAAKALGATKAELIRYATSGDVSGDFDEVVGYAGIAVLR